MIPRTAFQQFLPARLHHAMQRIEKHIWTVDPTPLDVRQSAPTREHRPLADAAGLSFTPVTDRPYVWGTMFDQCWWKVTVPAASDGGGGRGGGASGGRYLVWRDQAEATVYHDNVALYGLDPGHHYAPLPDALATKSGELLIESACCRTGIWVSGESQGISDEGSVFTGAFLGTRDEAHWQAYFDLEVLLQLALAQHKADYPIGSDLPSNSGFRRGIEVVAPSFRRLIDRLDLAVDAYETDGPAALSGALAPLYAELTAASDTIDVTLTGHAHIDLVWLWTERVGDFKAVHSFANALAVQDRYPEMTFGYSQPASYEAVGRRDPALLERVRGAIKGGTWEATGATYVESDTQLPCGEALVRAFELGQAGFKDLRGGKPSSVVWIPDVFGYTGVLPTLMAGFGVPYFYTTKMHWSSGTQFPYSSFKWRGNDGSEVLAHLTWSGYNGTITPPELIHTADQHRQAAVHPEALLPSGYGDGGGGVNEAMCERARRQADLAGVPRTRWGTIEGFFDRMAERRDDLPAWQGEMYLEYHRGVQTSHGNLKAAFRAAERGLQAWEAVRCVTAGGPVDGAAWKRVVFAQFHDYIPGSSIREVYDEHVPELEAIAADTADHARGELDAGAGDGAADCLFNPLPVARTVRHGDALYALPPLAGLELDESRRVTPGPVLAKPASLDNGLCAVEFNGRGEVTSMWVNDQEVALAGPACSLWTFPDHPANYDAWDIDRATLANGHVVETEAEGELDTSDALTPAVTFRRKIGEKSTATIRYRLRPGSPLLHVELEVDWHEPQTLLKLAVPTRYHGKNARFGAPYGSALRPQLSGPLATDAMFEVPGSRWAAVADDTERDGAMLITEAKYGFGCLDGLLHLSLLRSCKVTPSNRGGGHYSIEAGGLDLADLGKHTIRLCLGRYSADLPREENPAALADALYTPAIPYTGRPRDAGLLAIDGGESLVPAWAKPLDTGARGAPTRWVLRLHETLGRRGTARLLFDVGMSATPVNLRGERIGEPSGETIDVGFGPYQVLSLLVQAE